jgi:hypothetical protein
MSFIFSSHYILWLGECGGGVIFRGVDVKAIFQFLPLTSPSGGQFSRVKNTSRLKPFFLLSLSYRKESNKRRTPKIIPKLSKNTFH